MIAPVTFHCYDEGDEDDDGDLWVMALGTCVIFHLHRGRRGVDVYHYGRRGVCADHDCYYQDSDHCDADVCGDHVYYCGDSDHHPEVVALTFFVLLPGEMRRERGKVPSLLLSQQENTHEKLYGQ